MAQGSQVHHVEIQLSDTDSNHYATLQFSTPRHPSETSERLVLRLLAYALLHEEGMDFRKGGVSQGEDPDLSVHDLTGALRHWIEIGTPTEERLQKAARHTPRVTVVTHDGLLRRWQAQHGGRLPDFDGEILCLEAGLVESLARSLPRRLQWQMTISGGMLYLDAEEQSLTSSLTFLP
ncbi:YaeQ family protein [Thiolapillus sp.]